MLAATALLITRPAVSAILPAQESIVSHSRLTVDPFMSMYAGADDVFSAYAYCARYEDTHARMLWAKLDDFTGSAENMALRFVKGSVVDEIYYI